MGAQKKRSIRGGRARVPSGRSISRRPRQCVELAEGRAKQWLTSGAHLPISRTLCGSLGAAARPELSYQNLSSRCISFGPQTIAFAVAFAAALPHAFPVAVPHAVPLAGHQRAENAATKEPYRCDAAARGRRRQRDQTGWRTNKRPVDKSRHASSRQGQAERAAKGPEGRPRPVS